MVKLECLAEWDKETREENIEQFREKDVYKWVKLNYPDADYETRLLYVELEQIDRDLRRRELDW